MSHPWHRPHGADYTPPDYRLEDQVERVHVNDIRELVHRLRLGQSERAIARDLGLSRNTVGKYRVLASAALDRLTHHCHTLVMRGQSYRQRSRRKEETTVNSPPSNKEPENDKTQP